MDMGKSEHELEKYQIERTFSLYGTAILYAHIIERQIANLIAIEFSFKNGNFDNNKYNEKFKELSEMKFGKLINELKIIDKFPHTTKKELNNVLKKRNYLVHRYFWEKGRLYYNLLERQSIIEELRNILIFFDEICDDMKLEIKNYKSKHNIKDKEAINKNLENIVKMRRSSLSKYVFETDEETDEL